MDRLIWAAWRAFWVGLGASAVLITQSLLTPPASSTPAPPSLAEPASEPIVHAPARARSADPRLSRIPFESSRGHAVARVRNAS